MDGTEKCNLQVIARFVVVFGCKTMSDISRLLYITGQNNMQTADHIQNADYRLGVKERKGT